MPALTGVARRDNARFTLVVTAVVALCAFPMAGIVRLSSAPDVIALAMVLAALPVGPLVAVFLWLDRYEPEPRALLALGLLWGACVATMASLVLGGIGSRLVQVTAAQSTAVVAPITEEFAKGAFLLILLWWRRHELDGVLDGIVYAGMVGVGFAFVENILYLTAAWNGSDGFGPGGVQGVTSLFVFRCLVSPFAHPLFTAFTGIGVGIAVGSRSPVVRLVAPIAGYFFAVTAHSTWNRATLEGFGDFVIVYVVLILPALVGLTALAVWARSSERRVLQAALTDAADRGLVPREDIPWLVDLRARRQARAHAEARGGKQGLRTMKDYQRAGVELGFLHHRYLRGTAPSDFATRGRQFVTELRAIRPAISFPEQVVRTR
jgi:RsiW-degrading membrane proteinase PrsW (M82 family)